MKSWPWEYLFKAFNESNFPTLYVPVFWASVVALGATIVLYNLRTRQLHRHQVFVQMYEWMLWTSVITFGLIPIYYVFAFDFLFPLFTIAIGLGVLAWIRFVRFPPYLLAYQRQLAKARYFSRQRYARPETTIRSRSSRRRRRR